MNVVAGVLGIASAMIFLGAAADIPPPGFPTTLLSAGSSVWVPAFQHVSIRGNYSCGASPCGSPGEAALEFVVTLQGRLSGTLQAGAPIEIWVANDVGLEAACDLSNPPPPCAPHEGQPYLYRSPNGVTSLDLGQVAFDFEGAGHLLPAGIWTLLLINWGASAVRVTAGAAVTVVPTW